MGSQQLLTALDQYLETRNATDAAILMENEAGMEIFIDILSPAIDLVLIDPQSVGKRTHDLMDTVNAKKRWKTICWRVNKYLK
jgi:hypothetical protein